MNSFSAETQLVPEGSRDVNLLRIKTQVLVWRIENRHRVGTKSAGGEISAQFTGTYKRRLVGLVGGAASGV